MIHVVRASDPRFKTVRLGPGINVVLADTTEGSTATDTRNGVGKTMLMEVMHFCLGSSAPSGSSGLTRPELTGWSFTVELTLAGKRIEVTRSLASPSVVNVVGDFDSWPRQPVWNKESAAFELKVDDWRIVLGEAMFRLGSESAASRYRASFRSVFPYFARVKAGAYETPFKHFSSQREWQKQVCVAFLLDLSWEQAGRYQELKDQRDALRTLKKALEQGALGDPDQTIGRLRTQRIRLLEQIRSLEAQLASFEVHPEYRAIASDANRLTQQLHEIVNARVIRERTIAMYEEQAETELGPGAADVVQLFERAKVELSQEVQRTLAEAESFHAQVVANRRTYLEDEIFGLQAANSVADAAVEQISKERAHLMEILETKHALDELNRLNERLATQRAELAEVDSQIRRVTEVEERQAALEISSQELNRDSRRELAEREPQWSNAVSLFASNTEALYGEPGELVINLGDNGFSFDVNIPRSGSHGIDNMKIFAFDLMLAQRWSSKETGPRLLWHDSEIFDGVDERQVGSALQLASQEAEQRGFQYFCSLNSDDLPPQRFLGDLQVTPVLTLTDAADDGGLFGIRF